MNKYHAVRTVCGLNHNHASKAEAAYCDMLSLEKREAGSNIIHIDYQPLILLPTGKYRPDFCVVRCPPRGAPWDPVNEYIDVKGYITRAFTLIRRAFDATHPAAPLVVVRRKGKGWEQI